MAGWGACIGLAIGTFAFVLGASPLGLAWQEQLDLAWLFRLRGPLTPPADVVIVGMNKQSIDELDLPKSPTEWPRALHARLIDTLSTIGARFIVFDVNFAGQRDDEGDRQLADAISRSRRVLLLEQLERRQHAAVPEGDQQGGLSLEERRLPLPTFANAAIGTAPFPLPRWRSRVDRFWTFLDRYGAIPTLPALAVQVEAENAVVPNPQTSQPSDLADDDHPPVMEDLHSSAVLRAQALRMRLRRESVDSKSVNGPGQAALQPLVHLFAGPDTRYLNFYGPAGTIRTISYHRVIAEDQFALNGLSGACVFVGYSELQGPSKLDAFDTVFPGRNGVEISGVEIAATAFANLRADRTLKRPSPAMTVAVVLGIAVAGAMLLCSFPVAVGFPASLILGLAYLAVACYTFARDDLWLPLAVPLVIDLPLAIMLGTLAQYLRARSQREAMQHVVGYYVPEKVAHEMADHAVHPLAFRETTYAVCLALDAENFTSLSETLLPEEMATFLNDYFAAIAEPITRHKADFKEFHADSVMCAWMSDGGEDVAIRARACQAALDVLDAVSAFNASRTVRLGVRVGLHAGRVFLGNVGAGGQFSFRILGDIVNTASRVEGLNKFVGTRLLASEDVVTDVESLLTRPLGQFRLKGKKTALGIVQIVADAKHADDEQLLLCQRFADALGAFRIGDWPQAERLFSEVLRGFPSDGPALFYLERCQAQRSGGAAGWDADPVIRLDSK
jgi:adenylate cyclase